MGKAMLVAVLPLLAALPLTAQTHGETPEIRPFVGASIPTGDQRDFFEDAAMLGVQGAVEMTPNFHVLASFGWARGKNKFQVADAGVDVYHLDAGIEYNLVRSLTDRLDFKPFVGVGGGGRSYSYKTFELENKLGWVGYGAVGTEFQVGRTALRLEARNNFFGYQSPLPGGTSNRRTDVGLSLGLAYHFR